MILAMPNLRTRLFHIYARLRRPMTLGVRAAVENEIGQVFMVRHTYVDGWHMPGGGIEKDEPAIMSLARELEEEGGILLTGTPELVGIYSNDPGFRNDHVIFYRVPWGTWKQGEARQFGEIAETDWIDPAAPRDGVTKGSLQRFAELYRGADRCPYWVPRNS